MGAFVFDNDVFDSWLIKKSDEILSKVGNQTISNEEMLILILKAQTNHFHHMDIEFRDEFKAVRVEIADEFKGVRTEMKEGFDKVWKFQMWNGGVLVALFAGLYLKLFLA